MPITKSLDLWKFVSGVYTQLGSYTLPSIAVDTPYRIELSMSGSTIKVYLDGVERISVSDSSITAAGRAGLMVGANWLGTPNTPASNSSGLHLDNWKVWMP